jgi:hypothetical protein
MSQHDILLNLFFNEFYYDTKKTSILLKFTLFNKIKVIIFYVYIFLYFIFTFVDFIFKFFFTIWTFQHYIFISLLLYNAQVFLIICNETKLHYKFGMLLRKTKTWFGKKFKTQELKNSTMSNNQTTLLFEWNMMYVKHDMN